MCRWRQGGRQVDGWEVCEHVLYCLVLRVGGLQGGRREVQVWFDRGLGLKQDPRCARPCAPDFGAGHKHLQGMRR